MGNTAEWSNWLHVRGTCWSWQDEWGPDRTEKLFLKKSVMVKQAEGLRVESEHDLAGWRG